MRRPLDANAKDIPVLLINKVFHIGTLDPAEKGRVHQGSLEGSCLSVSRCPLAWRSIARLGGLPLWELHKEGATFLNVLALEPGLALREDIETWGVRQGYAKRQALWRTWMYDSEADSWGYMLFESEAEAVNEAQDESGPDDGPVTEKVEELVGLGALCTRMGFSSLKDRNAFDLVAIAWAEDTLPQVDGVWWTEDYDPAGLSAPRGGIFPSRVRDWTAMGFSFELVADEEDCLVTGDV